MRVDARYDIATSVDVSCDVKRESDVAKAVEIVAMPIRTQQLGNGALDHAEVAISHGCCILSIEYSTQITQTSEFEIKSKIKNQSK